jgi:uncharacterized protein YjgD (DUF1641 family)
VLDIQCALLGIDHGIHHRLSQQKKKSKKLEREKKKTERQHTFDEFLNLFVLLTSSGLLNKINLVLENEDVLELHDFNGGEMF